MTETSPKRPDKPASSSGTDCAGPAERPSGPAVTVQDLGGGRVRLSVRGDVSWPTALAVLDQLRDREGTSPGELANEAREES